MVDQHPIVGSWRVSVQIPGIAGELTNLARLSADGGIVVAFPSPTPAAPGSSHKLEYWTSALGEWQASGSETVRMLFVSLGADETGAAVGTHTVTASVTVDSTGTSWSGPFQIDISDATGVATGVINGTVSATRISVSGSG